MSPKGTHSVTLRVGDASASTDLAQSGRDSHERVYKDGRYLRLHPTWHAEDSHWKAKQIIRIIERNHLHPNSICEIGCGAGEVLNQLHLLMPNDCSFTGYEISPQAFQLCEQKEKERLHFHLSNLLQDDEAHFDVVLAVDVFEHVEDCFGFLRELRKKGRYKIFHIPLDLSVQAVLRSSPIIRYRQILGHIHYFTKETALATLRDTGYEVLDCFYTAHSLDLQTKSFKSWLAMVPRQMLFRLGSDMTVRILGGFSFLVLTQ